MKFPYRKYDVFYKPVLPVIFKVEEASIQYPALIDTGSDISIIHAEIAESLGLRLNNGQKYFFGGIGGRGEGFIHHVDMVIGGITFLNIPVVFTDDIVLFGFGILGHEGLFDRMKLVFEFHKKELELIPKNYKK